MNRCMQIRFLTWKNVDSLYSDLLKIISLGLLIKTKRYRNFTECSVITILVFALDDIKKEKFY